MTRYYQDVRGDVYIDWFIIDDWIASARIKNWRFFRKKATLYCPSVWLGWENENILTTWSASQIPRRKCSYYLIVQCCIKQRVNVHGSEGFKLWHFSTQRVWLTVWHVPRAWMSVTNSFTSLCNYQVFHSVGLFMQLKAFIKQIDFKIQICCYFWPQS